MEVRSVNLENDAHGGLVPCWSRGVQSGDASLSTSATEARRQRQSMAQEVIGVPWSGASYLLNAVPAGAAITVAKSLPVMSWHG